MKRKKYYIGIANTFHDPAIAIIDDAGNVLFAEAAERPYQTKRAMGCPPDNFVWTAKTIKKYCTPGAASTIARSWKDKTARRLILNTLVTAAQSKAGQYFTKKIFDFKKTPVESFYNGIWVMNSSLAMLRIAGKSMERALRIDMKPDCLKSVNYDHHLSHAGLACYGAPFAEAICLVVDGGGDDSNCISVYRYINARITLLERNKRNVNLAYFYSKLTILCGFEPTLGEEWKVMGLAASGKFNKQLHELFSKLYYVKDCEVKHRRGLAAIFETMRVVGELGNTQTDDFLFKADIAYNGQLVYSSLMNELLTNIHKKYPADNLILTGGCALNSSHNGEILDKTPFKYLHVPSAPADDGNALGSALLAYYADHPHKESIHKNLSPYLGTEITDDQLQHFLQFSGHKKVRLLADDKYDTVAALLADGKIIGWVQGRAEYGPRALGNRSILADPRRKDIKDIINERVKFREEFRPFAPSILHEYGHEYFEHYQESHYMERTLTFKKEAIDKVPGVVHVNNTGRLQTIKQEWNKELYHLLRAFNNISGVPVLLNTSFNIMGKPIIHTVEDALGMFLTTGLDALVINNYLVEK